MTGSWTAIDWNGAAVHAWTPAPPETLLEGLSSRAVQQARLASAALQERAARLPIGWEPLARLLLWTEGVASSQIEEVRAPLPEIAAAELDTNYAGDAAGWVVDNLNAVLLAVGNTRSPLSVAAMHRWHRTLMRGSYLAAGTLGQFRHQIGWVGGASPLVAAHVATPPGLIPDAMRDLIGFVNRHDVEPTVQAALAHAQFELIHPYADGNGRLGRVLVSWILVRRLGLALPPPVSVLLARDRSSYVGSLTGFREIGPAHWVKYFTQVVSEAARATGELLAAVESVLGGWERELSGLRPMAAARRTVRLLAAHPVLSADLVAAELDVSTRAARTALDELRARNILQPYQPQRRRRGRPTNLWVVPGIVDIVARWGSPG